MTDRLQDHNPYSSLLSGFLQYSFYIIGIRSEFCFFGDLITKVSSTESFEDPFSPDFFMFHQDSGKYIFLLVFFLFVSNSPPPPPPYGALMKSKVPPPHSHHFFLEGYSWCGFTFGLGKDKTEPRRPEHNMVFAICVCEYEIVSFQGLYTSSTSRFECFLMQILLRK